MVFKLGMFLHFSDSEMVEHPKADVFLKTKKQSKFQLPAYFLVLLSAETSQESGSSSKLLFLDCKGGTEKSSPIGLDFSAYVIRYFSGFHIRN